MLGKNEKRFGKLARPVLMAAAFLAVSLWASPDTAIAAPKRPRGRDTAIHRAPDHGSNPARRGHRFQNRGRSGRRPIGPPPRIMPRKRMPRYRAFYRGRVYFGPHGHYHRVYALPVAGPSGAVVVRPYVYCGDRLIVSGEFGSHGTHFGLTIGF